MAGGWRRALAPSSFKTTIHQPLKNKWSSAPIQMLYLKNHHIGTP